VRRLLHLNLKAEYFDAIVRGEKKDEYRLYNAYWIKKIVGNEFDVIVLKKGYPKSTDTTRIIERPWRGYSVVQIKHRHFGPKLVKVFCIKVN
jgi:hypothetical protein